MNYVYLELVTELHRREITSFNLGLAPLAGIEQAQLDSFPAALLRLVKQLGGGIFSFGGLEQFKRKFKPNWEPRFNAYEGGSAGLARVTVAMLRALRYKS